MVDISRPRTPRIWWQRRHHRHRCRCSSRSRAAPARTCRHLAGHHSAQGRWGALAETRRTGTKTATVSRRHTQAPRSSCRTCTRNSEPSKRDPHRSPRSSCSGTSPVRCASLCPKRRCLPDTCHCTTAKIPYPSRPYWAPAGGWVPVPARSLRPHRLWRRNSPHQPIPRRTCTRAWRPAPHPQGAGRRGPSTRGGALPCCNPRRCSPRCRRTRPLAVPVPPVPPARHSGRAGCTDSGSSRGPVDTGP